MSVVVRTPKRSHRSIRNNDDHPRYQLKKLIKEHAEKIQA